MSHATLSRNWSPDLLRASGVFTVLLMLGFRVWEAAAAAGLGLAFMRILELGCSMRTSRSAPGGPTRPSGGSEPTGEHR